MKLFRPIAQFAVLATAPATSAFIARFGIKSNKQLVQRFRLSID
jgi:hypothetical protein